MFQATIDPVGGSLAASAAVACLPLLSFFICLVGVKLKAHVSAIISLAIAIAVAIFGFNMPVDLTFLSATQGAAYGVFPVCFIIIAAVWFYEVTVNAGRSDDLRKLFDSIGGGDVRIQAVLIAFCFGALLESLAGFGAPIAITATMVLALGVPPLRAAMAVLIANTAPVAYGAVAIPITTAGNMAPGADGAAATAVHVAQIVGYIAPLFAFIVPMLVVAILDGKKGVKDCWLPALVVGISFGFVQWLVSNHFAYELTDIVASLVSFGVTVVFMRFWKPKNVDEARKRFGLGPRDEAAEHELTPVRTWMCLMPYAVIVILFALAKTVAAAPLALTDIKIPWPGLTTVAADGTVQSLVLNYLGNNPGTTFTFNWLSNCGSIILIGGIIVAALYSIFNGKGQFKLNFGSAIAELFKTCWKMKFTILTIGCVLALAYVMNFSGQTIAIGQFLAGTGPLFALLSPILGWIGTAVTGSDTSANALFSSLQAEAAKANASLAGVDPELFLASNTMGGVVGKMISPQSLAIAAVATGETESTLFKKLLPWSLTMLAALCVLIFLYSSVLNFILPA
ncbi:MAG: L-lactate permease [Coriobacteriia bacterium]|nr:L-lactate permease [Coriobacteriia bacterium]